MESFSALQTPPIVQMVMIGVTLILAFAGRQELLKEETEVCGGNDVKESIGNQMGATIAMLTLVLICQVFFFMDDMGVIKAPSSGSMMGAVSFDIFRIGVMMLADIARALALVFLVGAAYRIEATAGAAKGIFISATALLFIELVTGKFEMGHAICDQWYEKRKQDRHRASTATTVTAATAESAGAAEE